MPEVRHYRAAGDMGARPGVLGHLGTFQVIINKWNGSWSNGARYAAAPISVRIPVEVSTERAMQLLRSELQLPSALRRKAA